MPRIHASTNAEQREQTRSAIMASFGELLYTDGLTGLTMTHVARNAGIGRTAVYNYFADMGELLVAYTMAETDRFMDRLTTQLELAENPVEKLGIYVREQLDDLSRRHMPPGPAMRAVLSPEDFQQLGRHVAELQTVLLGILTEAVEDSWLPQGDMTEMARLVHGSLSITADRESEADDQAHAQHLEAAVLFILRGLGARFDDQGEPVRLRSTAQPHLTLAS